MCLPKIYVLGKNVMKRVLEKLLFVNQYNNVYLHDGIFLRTIQ